MKSMRILPATLCLLLPFAAAAADGNPAGIGAQVRNDLAQARAEVHSDLAKARAELETGNLALGDGLAFSTRGQRRQGDLPRAEITPEGDFLVAGQPQSINLSQRLQLLRYRGRVLEIARTGMDLGQRAADATLDAVGNGSVLGLLFGAFTGTLESRVERVVRQEVEPGVRGICRQLPGVLDSQQKLASSLPGFRPYATLEQRDVDECEHDVRAEFASL